MRLIDADKLTERLAWYCKDCDSYRGILCRACHIQDALDAIEDSPAVDAESVRHGKWVNMCECSVCGRAYGPRNAVHIRHYHYCPSCGAKMDGRTDDENHHL